MYDALAERIITLIDKRNYKLIEHLSTERNKVEIQIKINTIKNVGVSIITSSKERLVWDDSAYVAPEDKPSGFKVAKYKKELTEAVRHYTSSCRFYSLPITIELFVHADNSITGCLISNFVFKDN